MGLLSLSMPDVGLKLNELSDSDPVNLIETEFLLNDRRLLVASFSTKYLTQVYAISNRVELMRAVVQLVHWK